METKYNGWSNYETWRVKLELLDDAMGYKDSVDAETTVSDFADRLKEETEEFLTIRITDTASRLVQDYANAFLSEVNWYEIAESILKDLEYVFHSPEVCSSSLGENGLPMDLSETAHKWNDTLTPEQVEKLKECDGKHGTIKDLIACVSCEVMSRPIICSECGAEKQ